MILLGIPKASMRSDCLPCSVMTRAGSKKLGAVRFGSAGFVVVIEPGRPHRHLPSRLKIHPVLGKWMLYALILSDWTIEHHALARIFCRAAERILADSNRLHRDQDALGIEAVQNIRKALTLLADPILVRNK